MTDHQQVPPSEVGPRPRPEDVDTGFWLWIIALPMMVIGYIADLVTVPDLVSGGPAELVYGVSGVFIVVVASVVLTFLLLMRQGYRWARTLLTGSGVATVIYALTKLFGVERPTIGAVIFAVTAIIGSVCIAGGAYLLHRNDAHAFFTR